MSSPIYPNFIFWLHAYNTTLILHRRKVLLRCSVNQINLTIEDSQENKVIPIDQIADCRWLLLGGGRISQIGVWIEYFEGNKKQSCYLLCADPLRPKHYPYDGGEGTALADVINALRIGQTFKLSANPYERAFARQYQQQKFDPQEWDAMKSPLEYWELKQKRQPTTSVWLILGYAILILLAISFILAFFFGGITINL